MKIRTIDNGQSRYFILDEYMADGRTKPDILAVRESDGHIVVAHGWDETKDTWDYGNYYGDSAEALQKAAGDFGAIKEAYTELKASEVFEMYDDDYIDPRDLKQAIDFVQGTDQEAEIMAFDEIYNLKLNLIKEYFDRMTEYDFTDGGSGMPSRLYMETMAHQFEFDIDNFSDYIDELNQEVSSDYKPIVRVPHGMNTNQFICEMDDEVQQNIKRAVEEKEIHEGYRGSELEELVGEAMSNRLSSIEDSLTVIEEEVIVADTSMDKSENKSIVEKTPEEIKKDMKALGYEFEKEDFFIMFKDIETGKPLGYDGWEAVQYAAAEIQSVVCRYSIEELKVRQAGDFSVISYSDHYDDVIDRALLLKEKIGFEKVSNLSFNEKKEIFKGMTCEEQFKTVLESELPETEDNTQLQDVLYVSYMAGPQNSFLDKELRKDLSESIQQFMEDKTKQKGVELE